MDEEQVYDVAVIGAGIVGSATAYTLAKSSYKTLLLEQFALPHTRGCSHGQTRVTRKAYTKECYAKMMPEAYDLWETLGRETASQLYTKCGILMFGEPNSPYLVDTERTLEKLQGVYEKLTSEQLNERFPQMQMPSHFQGILDPEAGLLKAHKALVAFQTVFQRHGGKLLDEARVEKIEPGQTVILHTNHGKLLAKSVVIAAGPWASKLLQPLGFHVPLQPVRIAVNYWKEKIPGEFGAKQFPCFFMPRDDNYEIDVFGLPAEEYPNCVKIALHGGPAVDPDECDNCVEDANKRDLETVKKFIRNFKLNLRDEPCIVERCLYTMTPDEDFIIDTHPYWKNIVVGAGFSGHGFKFAPVTGKLLAELVTGKRPSYDTTPFRMDRFQKAKTGAKL